MHLLRTTTLGAALLIVSSVSVSGCSSSGNQQAATTQASAMTEQATTDTGPQPITPSEEAWVHEMTKLVARMNKVVQGTSVYTNASMAKLAKVYATCLSSLRDGGDPGRFAPAARIAHRACTDLNRAGKMMAKAAALGVAGIQSQAGADKFNQLVKHGIDAQFAAVGKLSLAQARAQVIGQELG